MRVGASFGERHSSVRSTLHLRTRETRPEDAAGEASAALISSAGTRRASGATGLSIGVRSATSVASLSELRFAEPAPTGCVGATQNGQSPSRSQSSDLSTDHSAVASRASSAAAMSSPIACSSAGSNSGDPESERRSARREADGPNQLTAPLDPALVRQTLHLGPFGFLTEVAPTGVSQTTTALGAQRRSGRPASRAVSLRHGADSSRVSRCDTPAYREEAVSVEVQFRTTGIEAWNAGRERAAAVPPRIAPENAPRGPTGLLLRSIC